MQDKAAQEERDAKEAQSIDCEPEYDGSGFLEKNTTKNAALENLKIFVSDIKDLMDEDRFVTDIIKILGVRTKIISDEVKQAIGSDMMPKTS